MGMLSRIPEYLWIYPSINSQFSNAIIKEFSIHPLIAQILVSRGFSSMEEIHRYFYSTLPKLHDPYLLTDMDKAVERVIKAIDDGENIFVYGDNDVDGMTGTALLTDFFTSIGAKSFFFVPNSNATRQDIITNALVSALQNECTLLITVDCGTTAFVEIEQITQKNIDVIVTDHHEPVDKIPCCVAILNPKLADSLYPNRELTGVGVAFKLAHAITNALVARGKLRRKNVDLKQYLDLVAMGTISDMGALRGENRILVKYGIKQLHKGQRVGLTKLFRVCGLDFAAVSSGDVSSKLAPRLNSLGRIADPMKGVELLLVNKDADEAQVMALEFDVLNTKRQRIEREVQNDVDEMMVKNPELFDAKAIVLHSSCWHPGVIAIVATRLTKQYNRPTIIIAVDNGIGKGSIRSISQFPLLPALKKQEHLLMNFGGHDFAAGLTIKEENIDEFKKNFIGMANEVLMANDIVCKLRIDAKVDFKELTFDLMDSMALMHPYGNENPSPILYVSVMQVRPPKIISKIHMKMYFIQGDRLLEGIAFGMAYRALSLRKKDLMLRVAFSPQINTFQNKSSIQLLIRDFKVLS